MKAKPGPKRSARVTTKAGQQLPRNPSEREVKDFIVAAIETSLAENLKQLIQQARSETPACGLGQGVDDGGKGEAKRSRGEEVKPTPKPRNPRRVVGKRTELRRASAQAARRLAKEAAEREWRVFPTA